MQQVFVVWDTGTHPSVYDGVNQTLRKGAKVAFLSSTAPAEAVAGAEVGAREVGQTWAVTVFVLEGSAEELGVSQ